MVVSLLDNGGSMMPPWDPMRLKRAGKKFQPAPLEKILFFLWILWGLGVPWGIMGGLWWLYG